MLNFTDCNGCVQGMTIVEEKIKGCVIFKVIVKYVLMDGRYAHVIRQKRVNVTWIVITVTGEDLIWKRK